MRKRNFRHPASTEPMTWEKRDLARISASHARPNRNDGSRESASLDCSSLLCTAICLARPNPTPSPSDTLCWGERGAMDIG